jgi:hypothetical protein
VNYVYIRSEPGLWTVGFYGPNGWNSDSDHDQREAAAARVSYLNGGCLRTALRDLVNRCDGAEGVRADGSNICTIGAHAALGDFAPQDD